MTVGGLRTEHFRLPQMIADNHKDDVNSGFWSVIEINVGVISVSLPPLRASIARYIPFLSGDRMQGATSMKLSDAKYVFLPQ